MSLSVAKADIIISQPIAEVWSHLMVNYYWGNWWGSDIRRLDPGWEQGAELQFSGSHQPLISIDKFIPQQTIQFAMKYMRININVVAVDESSTQVEIESIPEGATFPDGGANQKRIMAEKLARLKESLE
jgi:uncharacterized protein YndB with AHSA1/START domain